MKYFERCLLVLLFQFLVRFRWCEGEEIFFQQWEGFWEQMQKSNRLWLLEGYWQRHTNCSFWEQQSSGDEENSGFLWRKAWGGDENPMGDAWISPCGSWNSSKFNPGTEWNSIEFGTLVIYFTPFWMLLFCFWIPSAEMCGGNGRLGCIQDVSEEEKTKETWGQFPALYQQQSSEHHWFGGGKQLWSRSPSTLFTIIFKWNQWALWCGFRSGTGREQCLLMFFFIFIYERALNTTLIGCLYQLMFSYCATNEMTTKWKDILTVLEVLWFASKPKISNQYYYSFLMCF